MYASFLGISDALHLRDFHQPPVGVVLLDRRLVRLK